MTNKDKNVGGAHISSPRDISCGHLSSILGHKSFTESTMAGDFWYRDFGPKRTTAPLTSMTLTWLTKLAWGIFFYTFLFYHSFHGFTKQQTEVGGGHRCRSCRFPETGLPPVLIHYRMFPYELYWIIHIYKSSILGESPSMKTPILITVYQIEPLLKASRYWVFP